MKFKVITPSEACGRDMFMKGAELVTCLSVQLRTSNEVVEGSLERHEKGTPVWWHVGPRDEKQDLVVFYDPLDQSRSLALAALKTAEENPHMRVVYVDHTGTGWRKEACGENPPKNISCFSILNTVSLPEAIAESYPI